MVEVMLELACACRTEPCSCPAPEVTCGIDCSCCEFPDGTAPVDHARDCDLITLRAGDWSDCSCDGAVGRAALRSEP